MLCASFAMFSKVLEIELASCSVGLFCLHKFCEAPDNVQHFIKSNYTEVNFLDFFRAHKAEFSVATGSLPPERLDRNDDKGVRREGVSSIANSESAYRRSPSGNAWETSPDTGSPTDPRQLRVKYFEDVIRTQDNELTHVCKLRELLAEAPLIVFSYFSDEYPYDLLATWLTTMAKTWWNSFSITRAVSGLLEAHQVKAFSPEVLWSFLPLTPPKVQGCLCKVYTKDNFKSFFLKAPTKFAMSKNKNIYLVSGSGCSKWDSSDVDECDFQSAPENAHEASALEHFVDLIKSFRVNTYPVPIGMLQEHLHKASSFVKEYFEDVYPQEKFINFS
ncbi:hypothetical protein HPB51_028307 [Rhipicephalus microplus]|uniref:Uncharacterized protein n=1 Tax=Rhipicephalus microplus TaxID=6941 RepID=A0A9J6CX91_RHIMP|nr:hypothetical protein HPB51_028307 [Rhipicephalus microplus]